MFSARPKVAKLNSTLRSSPVPYLTRRHYASENIVRTPGQEVKDIRPSWLYKGVRLLNFLALPAIFGYAILYWDFGPDEHVFMPVRRFVARQKYALFGIEIPPEIAYKEPKQVKKNRPSANPDVNQGAFFKTKEDSEQSPSGP